MSEQQIADKLSSELQRRSEECERDVIAIRADGQAGIALVNPNLLLNSIVIVPGIFIADLYLN